MKEGHHWSENVRAQAPPPLIILEANRPEMKTKQIKDGFGSSDHTDVKCWIFKSL